MIYFNEHEPYAAEWLGNLWPHATVDRRSIHDVSPSDLAGVTRAHFFAGIGGWEYALELAGWPADRPVWTGSCPCQPFSAAGKRKGADDERHLWPEWFRLIRECRPPVLFGEQVSSRLGREWFAGVRVDLEGLGYAVGGADLCAAGVGAPHIRQRLYFGAIRVADAAHGDGWGGERGTETRVGPHRERGRRLAGGGVAGGLGHAEHPRLEGHAGHGDDRHGPGWNGTAAGGPTRTTGASPDPWSDSLWLRCLDGRYRRVPADAQGNPQSALFPLAARVPNRVGILRAAGNSIVPPLAAAFVRAFLDAVSDVSAETAYDAA